MEPELEKAKKDTEGLAVDIDDVLIYALYPVTGKRFLNWKYGKEEPPEEVRAKALEEALAEEELIKKARAGLLVEKDHGKEIPSKGENLRTFNVFIDNEYFEVGVEAADGAPVVSYVQPMPAAAPAPAAAPTPAPLPTAAPPAKEAPPAPAPVAAEGEGTPLLAPMPGMIVSYQKQVGDAVEEGETVVVLEAMKMENALPAPVSGTLKSINFSSGDSVAKGDVLCLIG